MCEREVSERGNSSVPGLVSVMMPAFNAAAFIGLAIDSVLEQRYGNWELLVVDDGSTDRTAEIAHGYSDARIRVWSQANGGEASARNRALGHVRGEYLAFLDADDQFLPGHLAATVAYLQSHGDRQGVYTDGYYLSHDGQPHARLSAYRRGPFEGRIFEQLVRASDVFGPPICTVLRQQAVLQHDLSFDTGIVIGPDWDFLTRFSAAADFGYVDEATCLYRVHQSNVTRTTSSERRRLSLARCREKAIQMAEFRACTLETRHYAFYDLLVNLLTGLPDRQASITQWAQFAELPPQNRALLFRLMASQAISVGTSSGHVAQWLGAATALYPKDRRGMLLAALYRLHPGLCRQFLRARKSAQRQNAAATPIGAPA